MVADWVSFESIQINLLTFAIEMVMGIFKEDDECEWWVNYEWNIGVKIYLQGWVSLWSCFSDGYVVGRIQIMAGRHVVLEHGIPGNFRAEIVLYLVKYTYDPLL